jgi:uncharacterized membrane protein
LWSIVALGSIVRLSGLDLQSLWYDEGLQYYVAVNNGIGGLFTQTHSFHPPLSFLINHLFLQIGQSEVFLRLPSALFGLASLPVFYILGRDVTSRQVALLSTSILALSPFHIWYSQDGRMYSQVLFFSLVSSVVLFRALKQNEVKWWALYVVVSTAGMYTQIFMVLALSAQFLWVLFCHRERLVAHVISGVLIFVLFLPWIIFLPWVQRFFQSLTEPAMTPEAAASVSSRAAFRAGFSWESIPYTLFAFSAGFSLGPTVAELHENRSFGFLLQFAPEILAVSVVFGTLFLLGVFSLYRLFGPKVTTLSLLGFSVPFLGSLLYALAPRATYNVRYSIVAFPYFCLIIGAGLTYVFLNYRRAGVILSLGLLAVFSTSLFNHFASARYAKEDVRAAVAFWRVDSNLEPLLTYRSHYVVSAYLTSSERERHSRLGGDVASDVDRIFSTTQAPLVYVLLARDWNKLKENALKQAYPIDDERSYPGVKILKIPNARGVRGAAGAL